MRHVAGGGGARQMGEMEDRVQQALALLQRGEGNLALGPLDCALALQPMNAQLHFIRANTLADLARFDDALHSFNRAIALHPDYDEACRNRGILRMLMGNFADGQADYERRRPRDRSRRMLPWLTAPDWEGEELAGRSILVSDATGLGDVIQFCRYLPLLADRGARVSFQGNAKLVRLLTTLDPRVSLLRALEPAEIFDFQCKLLSLPFLFRTRVETIPAPTAYLHAEPALVEKWKLRIGSGGFKVGIAWRGSARPTIDAGRGLPLARFAGLAAIPGVRLISLQKGSGLEELSTLPMGMVVETLGEEFDAGEDAFVDSAAVIANLDLVISCCTSLPHLSGALGAPTWVALKQVPEWRWLLDRADSPWYPSMRVFRQLRRGDWGPVFEEMRAALAKHVAKPGA